MQLYSQELELKFLSTLLNNKTPKEIKVYLLSIDNSKPSTFLHFPPFCAAFDRVKKLYFAGKGIPTFVDVCEDPALEEDFRDILRDSKSKTATSKKELKILVENLNKWRAMRSLYQLYSEGLDKLEASDKFDIDEHLKQANKLLNQSSSYLVPESTNKYELTKKGFKDVFKKIVEQETSPVYKTGFNGYDKNNGGLPTEGVLILAATTGGGKSTILKQLVHNIATLNKNVKAQTVSLEMGEVQEARRALSNLTDVPLAKLKSGKISKEEQKKLSKRLFKKFDQLEKNNSAVSLQAPEGDTTMETALVTAYEFGKYNVLAIDYIGLLAHKGNDPRWQQMSDDIRVAKQFSRDNNCLVIILAQLDDETNKLRSSKDMKTHVDVMWAWNYSDSATREAKRITVSVDKARDGQLFTFSLLEKFERMQVEDYEEITSFSEPDAEDLKPAKKNKKKSDDYALNSKVFE